MKKYNHTPQTKPSIDNKISTSDVKNMTGDKTAEVSILQTIKGCKAVIRDGVFINQQCAQNKLDGMEEMLEAVEKIISEHRRCSQNYGACAHRQYIPCLEDLKIRLGEMKEELGK